MANSYLIFCFQAEVAAIMDYIICYIKGKMIQSNNLGTEIFDVETRFL